MSLAAEKDAGVLEAPAATRSGLTAKVESPSPRVSSLPEQPLVVIEPSEGWVTLDLRGLWVYRELLYFLARRDIRVR